MMENNGKDGCDDDRVVVVVVGGVRRILIVSSSTVCFLWGANAVQLLRFKATHEGIFYYTRVFVFVCFCRMLPPLRGCDHSGPFPDSCWHKIQY